MHGGAVETDFSTSDQHVVIPLDGDVPHVQHGSSRKTEPLRIRSGSVFLLEPCWTWGTSPSSGITTCWSLVLKSVSTAPPCIPLLPFS